MRTSETSFAAAPIPAAYLNSGWIKVAEAALQALLPAGWSVETSESCDGELSLVIMNPHDDAQSSYLITDSPVGFALEEVRNDDLLAVCECSSFGHVAAILNERVRQDTPAIRRAA